MQLGLPMDLQIKSEIVQNVTIADIILDHPHIRFSDDDMR